MNAASLMPAAADQTVVYVYGVARAPHERESIPLPLQGIVPEAPVERLADADLTAFISLVPARLFGAEEFRAALNDAKWLRARVVAHEKVLERLRSRYDVIPFRFGSVYLDASEVSNALSGHRTELGHALDRVRGASEWGLKVYCDGEVLRGALEAGSKSIRRMRDALAAASPGAQFFLRKKYATALDAEAAAAIAACGERVRRPLDGGVRETVEIALEPGAMHGWPTDMVLNVACLVATQSLPAFRRIVAALKKELAAEGITFELTGPWPPYHFVSSSPEGIGDGPAPDQ